MIYNTKVKNKNWATRTPQSKNGRWTQELQKAK